MAQKKISLIAQFPPPMHGLSKAVETLYHSNLCRDFGFEAIDIKDNRKFMKTLCKIRKSRADLFYFTISQTKGGNLRDLIILKLLDMQKKKCIIHLHGGYYRTLVDHELSAWQKKANYRAISKLDGAIVLSPSLIKIFEGMIPHDKIFVVPNCVDDTFVLSKEELDQKITARKAKKTLDVLYLSNFIKTKGYPQVLSMARLEKKHVDAGAPKKFHFHFAGKFFDEKEKNSFKMYVEKYALHEFVTYHGIVGGNEKKALLKQCDIFTLLTRYPNEGQPISILEAMGNGMCIVTTDHAGIPDIVKDGINGIIADETNVSTIAERILKTNLEEVALTNYRAATTIYTQSAYLNHMKEIFQDVVSS